MTEIFKLFSSAIIGGVVSPLVLSFLNQRLIWRSQKRLEYKKIAFDEAIQALAMLEADALDTTLQSNKSSADGIVPRTNFHPGTRNQIQKSLALVEAFFSSDASKLFGDALSSNISLQNIPNTEHSEKRTKAIRRMADELALERPWWKM